MRLWRIMWAWYFHLAKDMRKNSSIDPVLKQCIAHLGSLKLLDRVLHYLLEQNRCVLSACWVSPVFCISTLRFSSPDRKPSIWRWAKDRPFGWIAPTSSDPSSYRCNSNRLPMKKFYHCIFSVRSSTAIQCSSLNLKIDASTLFVENTRLDECIFKGTMDGNKISTL